MSLRFAPRRFADGLNAGATGVDLTLSGKARAQKFRASTTIGSGDVSYGWEIDGRADNDRNGVYLDGAIDNVRFASAGALNLVLASGVVAISALTANNGINVDGTTEMRGRVRRAGDVAPAALAAGNNNDWAGAAGFSIARVTPDGGGASVVTGIANGHSDGDELYVHNIGAVNFALGHQNAASAAANRILCNTGANLVVAPDAMAYLWYDPVATRWRARLANT